jgi:ParB family chromosome partitioning protein
VPVIIGDSDDAKARETSLALNVIRTNMHPVDEFRAFHELHADKKEPQTAEQIAARFGISTKSVEQRLALGALDESVLNAWLGGEIDAKLAKLFTMQPSKKMQKAAIEKARNGHMNDWAVKEALGLGNDTRAGKLLTLVTEDAYIARGGKINRDLFAEGSNDNTMISDTALLQTMAQEMLDAECARLTAEGWGTVTQEVPDSIWNYPRIEVTPKATKEETARLKAIEKKLHELEESDEYSDEGDDLQEEADAIKQKIEERALLAIDAKIKAKGIAFVSLTHDRSRIEIKLRAQPAKEKALDLKPGEKSKSKKIAPEDAISQALLYRQAEQLSAAAQLAIVKQSNVALAVLIASLTTHSDAVQINARHHDRNMPKFDATLASALKMTTAQQIEALTKLTARNVTLYRANMREPVLNDAAFNAVASAINGKALTTAIREKFDAKDFFNSVSRAAIVEAVREAMGDDHAGNVAKMDKAGAVKFAIANLPKTKWLPKQLRVTGYDGPAKKAKGTKAKK